jgi:ADP-ribose pyrophosphatase YjhB (NUDIX family)
VEPDSERPPASAAPPWLTWVRTLQGIAQAGMAYGRDPYDLERYEQVQRIAADIAARHTGGDADTIANFFAAERGYPTPKIDVRAAVIVEHRILLVQERDDDGWTMPGGWADIGESAAEAVVRETQEEAGLAVAAVKLIALLERERRGHPVHPQFSYKAFFACVPLTSEPPTLAVQDSAETRAAGFFERAFLPQLSVARITADEIDLAFAHHADPSLPTEFD